MCHYFITVHMLLKIILNYISATKGTNHEKHLASGSLLELYEPRHLVGSSQNFVGPINYQDKKRDTCHRRSEIN